VGALTTGGGEEEDEEEEGSGVEVVAVETRGRAALPEEPDVPLVPTVGESS